MEFFQLPRQSAGGASGTPRTHSSHQHAHGKRGHGTQRKRGDGTQYRFPVYAATFGLLAAAITLTGCTGPWDLADQRLAEMLSKDGSTQARGAKQGAGRMDYNSRLTQGRQLQQSGKLDEARKLYEQLIVEFPEPYQAYHGLALVADDQRRYREAQALYAEALRRHPNDPLLFNDLGYCLFLDGQLGKAESALLKAVSLAPAEACYRNNLGLVYGHQGKHDLALEQFRSAGSEADAQYNLAFVLASQDNIDGAKACFHKALAADPTYLKANTALANFERYERNVAAGVETELRPHDSTRWVPYVEGGATSDDAPATGHATTHVQRIEAVQMQAPGETITPGVLPASHRPSSPATRLGSQR